MTRRVGSTPPDRADEVGERGKLAPDQVLGLQRDAFLSAARISCLFVDQMPDANELLAPVPR